MGLGAFAIYILVHARSLLLNAFIALNMSLADNIIELKVGIGQPFFLRGDIQVHQD